VLYLIVGAGHPEESPLKALTEQSEFFITVHLKKKTKTAELYDSAAKGTGKRYETYLYLF